MLGAIKNSWPGMFVCYGLSFALTGASATFGLPQWKVGACYMIGYATVMSIFLIVKELGDA